MMQLTFSFSEMSGTHAAWRASSAGNTQLVCINPDHVRDV